MFKNQKIVPDILFTLVWQLSVTCLIRMQDWRAYLTFHIILLSWYYRYSILLMCPQSILSLILILCTWCAFCTYALVLCFGYNRLSFKMEISSQFANPQCASFYVFILFIIILILILIIIFSNAEYSIWTHEAIIVHQICPAQAITIEAEEREDGSRRTTRWRIVLPSPFHLPLIFQLILLLTFN